MCSFRLRRRQRNERQRPQKRLGALSKGDGQSMKKQPRLLSVAKRNTRKSPWSRQRYLIRALPTPDTQPGRGHAVDEKRILRKCPTREAIWVFRLLFASLRTCPELVFLSQICEAVTSVSVSCTHLPIRNATRYPRNDDKRNRKYAFQLYVCILMMQSLIGLQVCLQRCRSMSVHSGDCFGHRLWRRALFPVQCRTIIASIVCRCPAFHDSLRNPQSVLLCSETGDRMHGLRRLAKKCHCAHRYRQVTS
ncbi:UNVERIFIED_CONTAM: hypothetical protein HHA_452520 [Hammondia hammondi]|eukprot:XP_008885645.1 hypothetical protein HHA_452520 [Hammondia hammondi]